MRFKLTAWLLIAVFAVTIFSFAPHQSKSIAAPAKKSAAASYLGNGQSGDLEFKTIGRISFGPDGLLLVAEPKSASVVAIDTGDVGGKEKLPKKIEKIDEVIAGTLGGNAKIHDIAVNPASGRLYLSVQRKDGKSAILTISGDSQVRVLDTAAVTYSRVTLPSGSEKSKVSNITDVKFAGNRVLAAGQSNEQFSSKIYSLPVPLVHGSSANIYSAETYHVAHGRWETRAPIQSFVPVQDEKEDYLVGSFACTPIAKFSLSNLESGAKVKGTSVVELGSGNRPLDMFTYKSDGKEWLVCHTDRFHFKRSVFGPSRLWGVRVSLDYLNADDTNEKAARRDVKKQTGPEGIEIVEALFGAQQVDKVDDGNIVVLRESGDHLDLEVAALP